MIVERVAELCVTKNTKDRINFANSNLWWINQVTLLVALAIFPITMLPPVEVIPQLLLMESPFFGKLTLVRFILLLLLVIIFVSVFGSGLFPRLRTVDVLVMVLFLIASVHATSHAISRWAYYVLIVISSYIIGRVMSLFGGAKFLSKLEASIRLAGLVEAALVIYTFISGPFIEPVQGSFLIYPAAFGEGVTRSPGTIGHPVVAAAVLLPALFAWLEYALCQTAGRKKYIAWLCFSVMVLGILLTFSRGAWLAFLVTLLLFLLVRGYIVRLRFIPILALLLLCFYMTPIGTYVQMRLSMTSINDGSISHRLLMYGWVTERWLETPFSFLIGNGVGYSREELLNSPPPDGLLVVDNIWLTMLMEVGLVGTAIILIVQVLSSLKNLLRGLTWNQWVALSILSLSIDGLTFETFFWEQVGVLIWLLTGVLSTMNTVAKSNKKC
ncbi:O-antigen ligase family protein [Desulfofundulus thermosubterraneus]|uniref:O-antigen ligase like membrane protein n=1 Tax=Desulfofundulus thermosubterraneus DSM 16057 TaxID=1121432 RepID=A0A1M6MQF8_9FIRM|nr:O-antigen ligase family protein [Desulfofundulus thermosubterraneus]SHJ85636.1 O-antigen ligase like membrane protein [Desulfofundulus thermosubterraneus DSM 16057]